MRFDMTYAEAVDKADNLIALNDTVVHLHDGEVPWDKAIGIEGGASVRLSGPAGCYVVAEHAGLTFKWSVDFETRDANGRGVSLFDRERLRDVAMKLPPKARAEFARFLETEVLPPLARNAREIRRALNQQIDSMDCVRGLIAFANEQED
jgi:hypothetical protein